MTGSSSPTKGQAMSSNSVSRRTILAGIAAAPLLGAGSSLTASAGTRRPVPGGAGAAVTGHYRDLFWEAGIRRHDSGAKIAATWRQLFCSADLENERIYFEVGRSMAYIYAPDTDDVRSEGQSYGMMIALQLNQQREFDRLWAWTHRFMRHADGPRRGYFAWHCRRDGTKINENNASDGEIWLATALFMAESRWGGHGGIFAYGRQAQAILTAGRSKEATASTTGIHDLFDPDTALVRFVTEAGPTGDQNTFTDPSYMTPAFLELWARHASHDRDFWRRAAGASRRFLHTTVHPQTCLMPDYANFDGSPKAVSWNPASGTYSYDARRTHMNAAMDWQIWKKDRWQIGQSDGIQAFFARQGIEAFGSEYTLPGEQITPYHQAGHVAMVASAGMARTADKTARAFTRHLYDQEVPTGLYRYYDSLLHLMGLLQAAGRFRLYGV